MPHDEAEDGHDTVEWLAGLSYMNGKVGMFGGSYEATTQLTAASLRPEGLVAIFPRVLLCDEPLRPIKARSDAVLCGLFARPRWKHDAGHPDAGRRSRLHDTAP